MGKVSQEKVAEMSDDAFEKMACMASSLTKPAVAKRVDNDCARRAKRARTLHSLQESDSKNAASAPSSPIPVVMVFQEEPF